MTTRRLLHGVAAGAATVALAVVGIATMPTTAQAAPTTATVTTAKPRLGCLGEPVQLKPYLSPPFRSGKSVDFGWAEWHFPPSCEDQMKRSWVKIFKVKKGKDPGVFYTTKPNRYSKKLSRGTYRVKVVHSYRYYKGNHRFGPWHYLTRTATIRIR